MLLLDSVNESSDSKIPKAYLNKILWALTLIDTGNTLKLNSRLNKYTFFRCDCEVIDFLENICMEW